MPLEALYREVILDHHKNPRNFGALHGATVRMRHENPACGDYVELGLELSGTRQIQTIKFAGWGCALSRASASMMTLAVQNQTPMRAREILASFRIFLAGQEAKPDDLGDLLAFAGVREFPARLACVLLPWNALAERLEQSPEG